MLQQMTQKVQTDEAEPEPIKCLEYNYGIFGEDYYFVNWYDESQPLDMRRETVSYPTFRQLRKHLESIPVTTTYHDNGAFYQYDIEAQVCRGMQQEVAI